MMIIYIAGIQNIPGELIEAKKDRWSKLMAAYPSCDTSYADAYNYNMYIPYTYKWI